MRTLPIMMSKAAKNRLVWLKDDLPLPLDPETLGPFGIRFSQDVLCITHKDRDIAFVPAQMRRGEDHFDLHVAASPSDVVDTALRTLFGRLTQHLDRVGRVIAEEKRQAKAVRDAEKARVRAQEEVKLAEAEQRTAHLRSDDSDGRLVGVTYDMMLRLKMYHHPDDAVYIPILEPNGAGRMIIEPHIRQYISISAHPDGLRIPTNMGLNAVGIAAEITRVSDRNTRIHNPRMLEDTIRRFPDPQFSIAKYVMSPVDDMGNINIPPNEMEMGNDFSISVKHQGLEIRREGCLLCWFSVRDGHHSKTPITSARRSIINESPLLLHAAQPLEEDEYARIGSMWISRCADLIPDFDAEKYRIAMDPDLEADAAQMGTGYGF